MKCKVYLAAAILGIGTLVLADFTSDFQDALKLFNEGKNAESLGKFTELAKLAPNPGSKSDTLYYAVMSAIKLQQFKKAEDLIADIQRESTKKLCQMNLMLAQGKLAELVTAFKDEDLTTWSDFHIYDALITRGFAYMKLKQYGEALTDFRKAEGFVSAPVKNAQVLNLIGITLEQAGDDEQALSVYRQIEEIPHMKGYGFSNDAIISAAKILSKQKKYDEALKEMAKIVPAKSGYWHAHPLMVQAELYAAQGKKDEAVAKYNEALQGAPEDLKKSIQTAIEKLK